MSSGCFSRTSRVQHPDWFQLDNQARIFPSILSDRFTTVFRLSALLREPVRLPSLERALTRVYRRMPYLEVTLRRGLFWHYLERCPPVGVQPDLGIPCMDRPRYGLHRPLVLVRARGRRIAVEASHIVTDGTGALRFFQQLLELYALESEENVSAPVYDDPDPAILAAEQEYSSRVHAGPHLPDPPTYSRAWHLGGARLPRGYYRATVLRYNVSEIRARAKAFDVTLTDYLLAIFLFVLQTRYHASPPVRRHRRGPIRVFVPVNMRPMVASRTMRNFFVYIMIELDPRLGRYEFGEIVHKVHHQMRVELDPRSLRRQLARNVRAERRLFVRLIPIGIKDVILRFVHRFQGETINTASLSNLGRTVLEGRAQQIVESIEFLPPPSPITGVNMAVIGFQDTLSIGFGSTREDLDVERDVARALAAEGCIGRLRTNWR